MENYFRYNECLNTVTRYLVTIQMTLALVVVNFASAFLLVCGTLSLPFGIVIYYGFKCVGAFWAGWLIYTRYARSLVLAATSGLIVWMVDSILLTTYLLTSDAFRALPANISTQTVIGILIMVVATVPVFGALASAGGAAAKLIESVRRWRASKDKRLLDTV